MDTKSNIIQKLSQFGILESDISFRGSDWCTPYFTYQGWSLLPTHVLESINTIVSEKLYEDYDGDGDGGRPIILRKWYYEFVNI